MYPPCSILSGLPAAAAQVLLLGLAVGALAYKRHVEFPRREWSVWAFDVTKQFISTLAAHVCGLTIAYVVEAGTQHLVSQCAWYLVAFCTDTTLGTAVALGLHALVVAGARRLHQRRRRPGAALASIAHCGDYGDPPRWHLFLPQLGEWVAVVILARVVCGLTILVLKGLLIHVAAGVDAAFASHTTLELFAVMVVVPVLLNLAQALLQDAALKFKSRLAAGQEAAAKGAAGEPAPGEEAGEALELVRLKPEPASAPV